MRALWMIFPLFLAGCLEDPELRSCGQFEFGTEGCGEPCDVYCEEMIERCPGRFPSVDVCRVACKFEPPGGVELEAGNLGDEEGDTLACRITAAIAGRCDDAGLGPSRSCSEVSCLNYCEAVLSTPCGTAYAGQQNCLAACRSLRPGRSGEPGNTVACRLARVEELGPAPTADECAAATVMGGGACGTPCEVYCDFLERNCRDGNQIYPDRPTCEATCRLMSDGSFDDWRTQGDSVACRIYHAGPPAELAPGLHCPHAAVYNPDECGIPPGGAALPADWPCPTFCTAMLLECRDVYPDLDTCRRECPNRPELQGIRPRAIPPLFPMSTLECPAR